MIDLRVSNELAPLIKNLDISNGVMLEVGVYQGEAMRQFMDSGKFKRYFGVDWWCRNFIDPHEKWLECVEAGEAVFDEVAKKYPVVKMKMTSAEAAGYFSHYVFDFIYIDGNHNYEFIKQDIELWWPKVKVGGYFGGHDYSNLALEGVKRAVEEKFGVLMAYPDMSWMVKKYGL